MNIREICDRLEELELRIKMLETRLDEQNQVASNE